MQLTSVTALILTVTALISSACATTVSYDETYDNPNGDIDAGACFERNGLHPLKTYGSLPIFPNIGGAAAIAGYNSPNCFTCWELTYQGESINILAIDHAEDGFNISLEALNTLTHGQGVTLGRVNATATQVDEAQCGL
ncbi:Cerato-platanin [Trametes sanguinea]|nr:Cerato-platanin [Trametes sanguinea]